LHKLTAFLAVNYSAVGIEGLNIKGMLANHKLAKHIADGAFYELSANCCIKQRQQAQKWHWRIRFSHPAKPAAIAALFMAA
jgi:hypothetical protein